MVNRIGNPKLLIERAEEARIIAEEMKDPNARRMMLNLANDLEEMARWLQERGGTSRGVDDDLSGSSTSS